MNKFLFLRCPGGGLSLQRPSQRKQKMQSLDQGMTTVGGGVPGEGQSQLGRKAERACWEGSRERSGRGFVTHLRKENNVSGG